MLGRFTAYEIMAAWLLGTVIAGCGVVTYSILGSRISQSGGEYEYLSRYLPPWLSLLIGYGTLLLGFICPIAFDATAGAYFLFSLQSIEEGRLLATVMVLTMLIAHGINSRGSNVFQDVVASLKYLVVLVVLLVGYYRLADEPFLQSTNAETLLLDNNESWLFQQYWIAYAFSGFNAVIYVAGRFRNPTKDVPRSLLFGFLTIAFVVVGINLLLVSAIEPVAAAENLKQSTELQNARMLLDGVLGERFSTFCGFCLGVVFVGAMSASMMLAPDILGALSRRGQWFSNANHRTNTLLVGGLALVAIWFTSIRELVVSFSAYLFFVSALTALTILFKHLTHGKTGYQTIMVAIFGVVNIAFLFVGVWNSPPIIQGLSGVLGIAAMVFYLRSRVRINSVYGSSKTGR